MSAAHDILAELQRHRVRVERTGDRIRLRAPVAPPADLVARIRKHKEELLLALPDRSARPVLHFRMLDHGSNAWATALGRPGESTDDVVADLRARYGTALAEMRR